MNDPAQTDTLQERFAKEYPEKLFYFCLKRTGDPHEAEDLASDVTLHVLTALGRGVQPEHFSAWVWQIAHNRYCAWAKEKRRRADALAPAQAPGFPDGEADLSDPEPTPEETLLHAEALRLLRRELAFTSADYRHIVVAYYFDGVRLSEIADRLGLPDGTVRSKLHRARNLLKEGMEMERTFGKRSYQPTEVSFYASGNQPSGLPWRAIQRKIPKNILCEANNNPCTLEELAIELGVALPYIEEETQLLLDAELMRKTEDGKLLTNFLILSKDVQEACNELCCTFAEQQYETLWTLAGESARLAEELNVPFGTYPPEDVQMYFAKRTYQKLLLKSFSIPVYHRADGGNWGVIGFEYGASCRLPGVTFNNNCTSYSSEKVPYVHWDGHQASNWMEKVFCQTRYTQDVPNNYCLPLLRAVADGTDPASFGDVEREQVEPLLRQGFLARREDGSLFVDAIVIREEQFRRLEHALLEQPAYASLTKAAAELADGIRNVLLPVAGKYFRDELDYYAWQTSIAAGNVITRLWKDRGLYPGASSRFCTLYVF